MESWPQTGQWLSAGSISGGHIHHSYKLITENGSFFLQKINESVFADPVVLEENLRVLSSVNLDSTRIRMPIPYPTKRGNLFRRTIDDGVWRLSPWIEGRALSHNPDTKTIKEAVSAIAEWAKEVNQISYSAIQPPLPNFHQLPSIWNAFCRAWDGADGDRKHRASETCSRLAEGAAVLDVYNRLTTGLPLRIIHGDPKPDNFLIDLGPQSVAIVDLDTVMPGYLWMEIGDMVRSMGIKTPEDDDNLSEAGIYPEKVVAILETYSRATSSWASAEELGSFQYGPLCIIFEQALRFLTDYLQGDRYYSVNYPEHNFVRAQNQLIVWESYAEWLGW